MNFHHIIICAIIFCYTFYSNQTAGQEPSYKNIKINNILSQQKVDIIHEDINGVLWIAANDQLWKYKGDSFENFGNTHDIYFAKITAIKEIKSGILCIATAGEGLFLIEGDKTIRINKDNMLPSNTCNNLFIDDKDVIWAALDDGLVKLKIIGPENFEVFSSTSLEEISGIRVNDVFKSKDKLWVISDNGLIAFDEKRLNKVIPAPPIIISTVRINGKDTIVNSHYVFDNTIHDIKISFESKNLQYNGNVSYKYKMLGIDTSWIYTDMNSVQYSYLPSGRYTFLVSGINEDGFSSKDATSIDIYVQLPFYQTWWFKAIIINILGLGLLLFYFFRIKQIRHREKEKTRLHKKISEIELKALRAQMNPHFIFNSLNSIQHFITNNDQESAHKYLSKFAKLMRMILESSKKITISIEDEIKSLEFYLELESLRFENQFDFNINVDPAIDISNSEIPTMILQPYVENAIWHGLMNKSTSGTISISIKQEDHGILCIIEDNGIGREKAKELKKLRKTEYKSVGMLVTKERLEILNDIYDNKTNIKIKDLVDKNNNSLGTRVIIKIPTS